MFRQVRGMGCCSGEISGVFRLEDEIRRTAGRKFSEELKSRSGVELRIRLTDQAETMSQRGLSA